MVLECVESNNEATPHYASIFLGNYGLDTPIDLLLDLFVPRLEAIHYLGDAFPRFWPNFGPGIQAAVERWGDQLSIGFTDLGGNLDILAHLRGTQQLLLDLINAPQEVDRLVRETNMLWLKCYEELFKQTQHGHGITCWGPC